MRASLWIVVAVVVFSGCSNRLSPQQACDTLIDSSVRCGTYRVGSFGGSSMEDDVARCTASISLLNDHCQALFSDVATCSTRPCAELAQCQPTVDRFDADCIPSTP